MMKQLLKTSRESRKSAFSPYNASTSRQTQKVENHTQFTSTPKQSSSFGSSKTTICENSACRALLPIRDDAKGVFCRRCSCCLCEKFDDNKDPSLWLACESESDQSDSCGSSCHIECAFQKKKLGVSNLRENMQLDGSYCCASCGKVSGILGCLIKQLTIAKDTRRVNVFCYRINLSYRLLEGTKKFKDLQEIITKAKTKLEAEVGPINGDSVKISRVIVSRLAIATDVRDLCSLAIHKANELLVNESTPSTNGNVDSRPAASRFLESLKSVDLANSRGVTICDEAPKVSESPPVISRGIDLNEDLAAPLESLRDEDNGITVERAVEPDEDNGSPFRASNGSGSMDGDFEHCVKCILWLECQGHIKPEFKSEFLNWFIINSTEQHRRDITTFIRMLSGDPKSLAGHLVDIFGDFVSNKKTHHHHHP